MSPNETYKSIVLQCLESINSPVALSLHIRYESDDLNDLPDVLPTMYDCPMKYYRDAQAVALFSKNESFIIEGAELENKAVVEFHEIEAANRLNNERWPTFLRENFEFVNQVKNQLFSLIGPSPSNKFYDMYVPVYGPGSTSTCSKENTTYLHKLKASPECTLSAIDLIEGLSRGSISRPRDYIVVQGNEFFTVPKNYKTRRSCAIEPHLNTWCQRALGLDLKSRLKRRGYDLSSIPDLNKYMLVHHTDDIATLDLKQASDRIYTKVLKEVLPPVWFDFLNRARSHYTKVNGSFFKNEKFSSMGNGFTFELESALFLSIVRAIVPKQHWSLCTVFGDDIMVPKRYGMAVSEKLSGLGFVLNSAKSYIEGPFKESCGVDIWNDYRPLCVRPVFLRKFPDVKKPKELIAFANYIRRLSLRTNGCEPKGSNFGSAYSAAVKLIPKAFCVYGPDPFLTEDLKLSVPIFLELSYKILRDDLFSIRECIRPKAMPTDENGWLHTTSVTYATRRVTEVPRYTVKPHNFAADIQLMYALAGGSSDGCVSRHTPVKTVLLNVE